ncbi:unnamed protein product [Adineta steineri]|uniref:ADP ribosyltransferase domain-containing protein n=1 Tax=Adineta steineri TaxID=433720 RepID=A0A813Y8T3_9BILA|nr:unnamed protein product [Adineta steineri]
MATTLTLEDTSQEKIDDKQCEIFCLFWLDSNTDTHETRNAEQKLRSVINYLKRFQEVKSCQRDIEQSSHKDRIILIVSGRLGQEIVPSIYQLRQVVSIYVYCMDIKRHEQWASKYNKVNAVLDDLDTLVTRITEDHNIQKKVDEPLPIDIFSSGGAGQSTMGVFGQFVFSQVLIDCLLRLKSNPADKDELIKRCKNDYGGNRRELEYIGEFEKKYTPDKALRWYTKDTFFYKSLNAALRKQNIHMMFLFREFIKDIQQRLQKYKSEKVLKVYRAQMMTSEELQRLQESVGKLISINSFFSTSMDFSKVFAFLKRSKTLEAVVFEIKADPQMARNKPFADISKDSDYPGEAEVLFMIGSIFRLDSIDQNNRKIWVIKMTLSSEEEHDIKEVLRYMKGQVGTGETNLRTLGKVLWKMGKFDLAEQYFLRLLKQLPADDPSSSALYEDLGELAALRGEYDNSVQWHQKSIALQNSKQVNQTTGLEELSNTLTEQLTTKSDDKPQSSSETTASEIDTEQFKQWLMNYIKQNAAALAQHWSRTTRHPNSVENFCYILENQFPITKIEQQTLRGLINLGFTFNDINSEECVKLVRGIQNEKIILILSKTSMENLAKSICEEPFLSAIYVIDSSNDNSFESKMYRGSFPDITRLCKQLEKDLPLLTYDLTIISSIPAEYTSMSTLNYVQAVKDILLDTDEKQNLKKEMIDFCREKYADNVIQLKLIDEFENSFQPDNALQWYLRQEAFVYKMLTRAFRILDVDILYRLRYFVQHLHRKLEPSSNTTPLTVYRTLRVRKDLFKKMCSYQEGMLSFNEFLLVSKDPPTAEPNPMNTESKVVHFQINLGAEISRFVVSTKSNEVLLTIGVIFRIEKLEAIDENTFRVQLTMNNEVLKAGQSISKELRDAIRGPFPLVRMGKLIRQKESVEYLEYFSSLLMDDPRTAGNEIANLTLAGMLHSLGKHCYTRNQYEQGLTHLQNSLKVHLRVLPSDDIRLTSTYNNIGSIYHKQDLNEKALEYHQKAYEIQKNSSDPDLESVAAYAGNIASVLTKLRRHKEAIKYYEIDLKVNQRLHQNKDSGEIAAKFHNLAAMQYRAQLYSEALVNYQKCLEMELRCHSAKNPTVATTYFNMATALEKLGRFKEAIQAMEKGIERLLQTKKEDDEEIQNYKKKKLLTVLGSIVHFFYFYAIIAVFECLATMTLFILVGDYIPELFFKNEHPGSEDCELISVEQRLIIVVLFFVGAI